MTKICPKCGTRNRLQAKFCDKCGTDLTKKKICPKCRTENRLNATFCDKCGTDLTKKQIPVKKTQPKEVSDMPKKHWLGIIVLIAIILITGISIYMGSSIDEPISPTLTDATLSSDDPEALNLTVNGKTVYLNISSDIVLSGADNISHYMGSIVVEDDTIYKRVGTEYEMPYLTIISTAASSSNSRDKATQLMLGDAYEGHPYDDDEFWEWEYNNITFLSITDFNTGYVMYEYTAPDGITYWVITYCCDKTDFVRFADLFIS